MPTLWGMELLTSSEVALRLGLTQNHVARMARLGTINPAMRLPGRRGAFLFDPATVERFAESRRKP